jgi:Cu+-exporting ATPase
MALERATPPIPAVRTDWTCPMHPEIVRDAPGICPICGMALERRTVSADADEDNPELRDMTRRFWLAAAFTLPLVILAMGDLLPGRPVSAWLSMRTRMFWEFALATPVCLWSAWPFYVRAVRSVINRSLNMFTLIGLGVSVAFVYSVVAALAPGIFPASFREGGEVAVYFEAAGVIVTLILLGQVLELRARSQSSTAIKAARDGGDLSAATAGRRERGRRPARRGAGWRPFAGAPW